MGIDRHNSRSIEREDVGVSVYEGAKRDATGNLLYATLYDTALSTGTTATGVGDRVSTAVTTSTSRAMASQASIVATTVATITNGSVALKRGGATVTSAATAALTAGTTLTTSNTFTSTPATWTLEINNVGGGTVNVSPSISKEDSRSA